MMSPRSFLYYNRQPSSTTPPSNNPSSSPSFPTRKSTPNIHAASTSTSIAKNAPANASTITNPIVHNPRTAAPPSVPLDREKNAQNGHFTATPIPTSSTTTAATMAKRKDAFWETSKLAPSSPPRTTTSVNTRPTTLTGPVQIPSKSKSSSFHHNASHRHSQKKSMRPRDVHSPDSVPPAMRALLAVTDIPRQRRGFRQRSAKDQPMTLEAVIERQQVCEKELSLTFGKSPMDLLLSPPEDLDGDDLSISDSGIGSVLSTRTVSVESMPSLGDSFSTDTLSSLESPCPSSPRRKRSRLPRRSLEPVSSPLGQPEDHPLSYDGVDVDDLDFRVFGSQSPDEEDTKSEFSFSDYAFPLRPLKSAFKSNLTASLRALRSAARSISAINFSSIPPDDFLTRSILTIDPNVPYTDERRPPVLEEEPSAALRRYLNPTTNARIEPHPATATPTGTRSFTASIQMQTYKVQRSRSSSPPLSLRSPSSSMSAMTQSAPYQPPAQSRNQTAFNYPPGGMRQREMRENSDFIRIAVMEMAMRKRGKLDDQRPGRARWALPPRKPSMRVYEVGADGVPARWIPLSP